MAKRGNSTWDEGIKYEKMKSKIKNKIDHLIYKKYKGRSEYPNGLAYLIIYAIQLRNGSRISEALEAWQRFRSGEHDVVKGKYMTEVRVRKKVKRMKTGDSIETIGKTEYRRMVYPEFVPKSILSKRFPNEHKITVRSLKVNARRLIGTNTHSLRFSFITHMANKGISMLHTANIIKHSDPKMLMRYVQKRESEEILVDLE